MANRSGFGEFFRKLIENLIRSIGRLVLPLLIWILKSAKINTYTLEKRSKSIQQVVGLLTLITLAIISIILWGGWQLVSILILHTWAMLLFAKTESFLHISIAKFWRQLMIVLQLGFIIILCFIDYKLSLIILGTFLLLAKILNILFAESLRLYSYFLQKDRFDAAYWWNKKKAPRHWEKTNRILLERRYLNSVVKIIWEFLKSHQNRAIQKRYGAIILKAWAEVRRYQILPEDLVLNYQQSNKMAGRSAQSQFIIGTACNFRFMQLWIQLSQKENSYALLLEDYLHQLSKELEAFIQKPFPLNQTHLNTAPFIEDLDQFLAQDFNHLPLPKLSEQLKYCYGLFYMTQGISKNL
jgi:hypothetical protein